MQSRFRNRQEAGRLLGEALASYARRPDVIVLALPRGGVPIGFEVAMRLAAPLDVLLVRKLGVPGQPELAMGAIGSGGVRVLNRGVVEALGISNDAIEAVTAREQTELERREAAYRGDRPSLDVRDRTLILVDDGLATGATMHAAVAAVRRRHPARLVVGTPIAAPRTCESLRVEVDEVVCARTPEPFTSVGAWYEDFEETTDAEVRALLERAARTTTQTA